MSRNMDTNTLLGMLSYRRPAGSRTERAFIARYLDSIPGLQRDHYGNRWLLNASSRTMIACHTDTVHWAPGRQRVVIGRDGVATLHRAEVKLKSNCLGADDTAGVYAALRMIEARVPVSFVFHRAEEIGGLGSSWIADNQGDTLHGFDRCISLDRRGTADVIESQCLGRCCSREFAMALSEALNMGHKPAKGIFTDSANYAYVIPECSNISVGYANEHRENESLDTVYLEKLITRLCAIDWEALPVVRSPVEDFFAFERYDTGSDNGSGVTFCWACGDDMEHGVGDICRDCIDAGGEIEDEEITV